MYHALLILGTIEPSETAQMLERIESNLQLIALNEFEEHVRSWLINIHIACTAVGPIQTPARSRHSCNESLG
jgi:hypothetical protein